MTERFTVPEPQIKVRSLGEESVQNLSYMMAVAMHANYLRTVPGLQQDDGTFNERLRPLKTGDEEWAISDGKEKVVDGKINIAVPFDQLSPGWQRENLRAGEIAVRFVSEWIASGKSTNSSSFIDEGGRAIHDAWRERRREDGTADTEYVKPNMVEYQDLSPEEKDKDVEQLMLANEYVGERVKESNR